MNDDDSYITRIKEAAEETVFVKEIGEYVFACNSQMNTVPRPEISFGGDIGIRNMTKTKSSDNPGVAIKSLNCENWGNIVNNQYNKKPVTITCSLLNQTICKATIIVMRYQIDKSMCKYNGTLKCSVPGGLEKSHPVDTKKIEIITTPSTFDDIRLRTFDVFRGYEETTRIEITTSSPSDPEEMGAIKYSIFENNTVTL